MVARRNSTFHNHCAIDRSIGVRWHGRINFLRVEISTAHSSKLGLRYSSRQLCHCVTAGEGRGSGMPGASALYFFLPSVWTVHERLDASFPTNHPPLASPPLASPSLSSLP